MKKAIDKINDYLKCNNLDPIYFDTPIYNNNSIKTILSRMPKNIPKDEKIKYIVNCIKVYCKESNKIDLTVANQIRNFNHQLTTFYLLRDTN